jgi:hypothetical protein
MTGDDKRVDSYFSRIRVPADGRLFEAMARDSFVATPTAIVRRQAIEEVGMFNESLMVCEDVNLWLRIASRWKIAAVRDVLVTVRKRSGSLSAIAGGTMLALHGGLASLQHVEASCLHLSPREQRALRRRLAIYYYRSGSARLTEGARKPARAHLAIALRSMPFHLAALVKFGGSLLPTPVFRSFARLYHMVRT